MIGEYSGAARAIARAAETWALSWKVMMDDPYKPPSALSPATPVEGGHLQLLWNPLAWLIGLTLLFAAESGWFSYSGDEVPQDTAALWSLIFGVFLAWWVYADRRARGFGLPFEFEAFVLFLWPVLVPYYLYQTRGRFGLLLGAGVWLLYLVPSLFAACVSIFVNA